LTPPATQRSASAGGSRHDTALWRSKVPTRCMGLRRPCRSIWPALPEPQKAHLCRRHPSTSRRGTGCRLPAAWGHCRCHSRESTCGEPGSSWTGKARCPQHTGLRGGCVGRDKVSRCGGGPGSHGGRPPPNRGVGGGGQRGKAAFGARGPRLLLGFNLVSRRWLQFPQHWRPSLSLPVAVL
jgi:hypothetical protein